MSTGSHRLGESAGAWLDRSRPLRFTFNGRPVDACVGDTVASALLANGIVQVGRSYKLHRPRGILSAGLEEPIGLVDIGEGAERTPNTRATDIQAAEGLVARTGNAWPSLRFDLASLFDRCAGLLPAGFYYKTFMWPRWHLFEPTIRRLAGLGIAADAKDPAHYDEVSRGIDTLVIGAGAAGMVVAIEAARAGHEVLLLESAPRPGGWLAAQTLGRGDGMRLRLQGLAADVAAAGVELRLGCTALGLYDHGLVSAVQTIDAGGVRERLWKIRARRIVLACGAFERPLLFPDNDRPGVMLAGAVERYAALYGVACGRRIVVAAACDSAYGVAHALRDAGIEVAAIVDVRPAGAIGAAPPPEVAWHADSSIVAVDGKSAVRGVTVVRNDGGALVRIDADCIAGAGGWTPAVNLWSMAGGKLRWDDGASMFVPDGAVAGVSSVGACAGVFDFEAALDHAAAIGRGASPAAPVGGVGQVPAHHLPGAAAWAALKRKPGKVFIDLQNDVVESDVALAARENYRSVEHLKRYTTLGMATDQGKTSNINALVLMGRYTERTPPQVGTTKFRPPFKPVTLNAVAGGRSGERHRAWKRMPGDGWHRARGALMEDFGGWLRPAAYPQAGEDLVAAAQREALHVRSHVGLFEGSPLGKIELFGPDAAAFLDLMYVGTMSTLAIGQARYGLLLDENGVVFDDGIVARLGEQQYWVNTTSGGVDRVALAFEEWLQCEYLQHRVLVTPVTSAWGNVTVAGPRAWALLQAAGFDAALAPSAMKHMTMRETAFGGATMRVLRASFSGELGYEINLPALHTQALLEHLSDAGRSLDAQPYGVEALMVMRTEKGFIHVGADTDGTTLPGDIGMDRGVAKKGANFVGRRSLLRPAALDANRMQLVGLLALNRRTLLPVGAAIAPRRPPSPIDGFVTSSCGSPTLGHPVALAMLRGGARRHGERIELFHMGRSIAAEVVKPGFFDPEGERLHGRD